MLLILEKHIHFIYLILFLSTIYVIQPLRLYSHESVDFFSLFTHKQESK